VCFLPEGAAKPVEARAMWVVRNSITSPEKVSTLIRLAKEGGFNTLLVQVRGRGDAYYDSDLEPKGQDVKAGYDPLEDVLSQAKKAGIAGHAWVNVMYVWSETAKPKSPKHILNAHPDWLAADRNGVRPTQAGTTEGAYLCPSSPEARKHVRDVIKALAENYDLAGIHLDYIRFPSADYCHCDGCLRRFQESLGEKYENADRKQLPEQLPAEWTAWRKDLIGSLVRQIRHDLSKVASHPKLTAAVWADRKRATDDKMQDWPHWCKEGWLDAVVPMNYATDEKTFEATAEADKGACGSVPMWLGIGAWKLQAADTAKRIEFARKLGAHGFSLFSYGGITGNGTEDAFLRKVRPTVVHD
jgi:uncharacterized lipoprotein YddW (UPF0748 family)